LCRLVLLFWFLGSFLFVSAGFRKSRIALELFEAQKKIT